MPFIDGDYVVVHLQEDEIYDVQPLSGGLTVPMSWIKALIFGEGFVADLQHEFGIYNHRGLDVMTQIMKDQCIAWMNQRFDLDEGLDAMSGSERASVVQKTAAPEKEAEFTDLDLDLGITDERDAT